MRINYEIPPVNGNHAPPIQEALSPAQFIEFVRQTCNDFTTLRRGRGFLGENDLIGGFATIGSNPVLAMLYGKNSQGGKSRSSSPANIRLSGYRTAQHLMQLAQKFRRPLLVFTTSQTSLQGAGLTEPHEAHGFSNHILTQCRLEVPIVLAVLSRWSSGDIFGVWLADKILALEQTRFSMTVLDHGTSIPVQAGAKYILHQGVIDRTVPVRSGGIYDLQVPMPEPKQLRTDLSKILEEVSHVSPKELMIRRKNKQERISQIASGTFGLEQKIKMFSSNSSIARQSDGNAIGPSHRVPGPDA